MSEERLECRYEGLYDVVRDEFELEEGAFSLLSYSGVRLGPWSEIVAGDVVQVCPKVLGGKGGFGSLLRAFGKQITMSTNKDACRDLTGRRIKQVNNEKKMREFLEKQAELAKKKEEAKLEKRKRRRKKLEKIDEDRNGRHLFVDPKYDEQKQKIAEDIEEALDKALAAKQRGEKSDESNVVPKASSQATESNAKSSREEDDDAAPVIAAAASSLTIVEMKKKKETVEAKKSAGVDSKLLDWMGVGADVDVSSSSSEEDEKEPAKKLKKV